MPQTSVPSTVTKHLPGLASKTEYVRSMHNGEASARIAPGRAVARGTSDDDEAELLNAAADSIYGVAMRNSKSLRADQVDDDGFLPGEVFDVLRKGRLAVEPEDKVTPASGVHVRMEDGQGGSALVVADFTFTAEADNDYATKVAHGLLTGDGPIRVANSGGALPSGISAATDYWLIRVDDDNFKFATTRANALAGTAINLTTDGTGTQTLSDTASTERVVTGKAGSFRGTPDGEPLVVADFTFTAEADDDLATATAHGLLTGDGPIRVANSGGALPTGIAAATDYWVIRVSANTFKFATTLANALAGTGINLTADGTGTQTLSDTVDTERVTTVDVSKCCRWVGSTATSGNGVGETVELDVDFTNASLAALG